MFIWSSLLSLTHQGFNIEMNYFGQTNSLQVIVSKECDTFTHKKTFIVNENNENDVWVEIEKAAFLINQKIKYS